MKGGGSRNHIFPEIGRHRRRFGFPPLFWSGFRPSYCGMRVVVWRDFLDCKVHFCTGHTAGGPNTESPKLPPPPPAHCHPPPAAAWNAVVILLLRARDKPFTAQSGWDLVVVDECLSVQNDTALQTSEAWRQVISSRCGVLMVPPLPCVPLLRIIPPPLVDNGWLSRWQTARGGGCTEHNIRFTCLSRRQQWWTSGLMDPERPPEHTNDALRLTDVQYGARVPTQTQNPTPPPPSQTGSSTDRPWHIVWGPFPGQIPFPPQRTLLGRGCVGPWARTPGRTTRSLAVGSSLRAITADGWSSAPPTGRPPPVRSARGHAEGVARA